VRDLAGKRDALLRQLQELEDTASKRTPEQLARERYALELEAARVLLALDDRGPSVNAKPGRSSAARTSRRAERAPPHPAGFRGFLWGIGRASAALLLGLLVYQSAKPREEGGSVTGDLPKRGGATAGPSGGSGGAADPEEAQLEAALARNPEDIDARLDLARLRLRRQDYMSVWNETTRVLERAPGNAQALAFQALVRLAMGQGDMALGMLKRALATDPNLLDGYVNIVIVYARIGRMKEAEAAVARASKRFPDRAADFQQLLADLRSQQLSMSGAGPAPGEADPHAGLGTPGDGAAGARPASASSGRRVSGTVDIDPALKSMVAPGAVLFVFVREAGVGAGPPRAVKRLPPAFPAAFELSEADAMMGEPFPDPLLIEARLDSDGNPLTRSPTDPTARLDRVKAGRTDVHLVLRRP
jgi:tetratricopeptide (TPR) repeat protein